MRSNAVPKTVELVTAELDQESQLSGSYHSVPSHQPPPQKTPFQLPSPNGDPVSKNL